MPRVILAGFVVVPPDEYEIIAAELPEHIRLSLAEPGCSEFKVTRDKDDPYKLSVYEEYVDYAAFQHHLTRTSKTRWAEITKNMGRHYNVLEEGSRDQGDPLSLAQNLNTKGIGFFKF